MLQVITRHHLFHSAMYIHIAMYIITEYKLITFQNLNSCSSNLLNHIQQSLVD